VGMFDQAMRGWRSAQRGIDARREVRTALQMLESDLRGMVVTNYSLVSGQTTNDYLRPMFIYPDGLNSSRLTFLTVLGTNAQGTNNPGDLCTVQYFVDTNVRSGLTNYTLFRRLLGSTATHSNLKARALLITEDQLLPTNAGAVTEELAMNVVYFRAEPKFWDTNGNNLSGTDPQTGETNRWRTKPDLVQLELTAFPQQKAQAFRSSADWTDTNNIQKFGKTYLWRVAP